MKNIAQLILAFCLLGLGYFVGSSWTLNNSEPEKVNISKEEQPTLISKESNPNQNESVTENTSINGLNASEKATIKLFEDAAPSVTFITTTTYQRNFFSMNVTEIPSGNGSGFVWDQEGHIITNYHVIQGAARAKVTLSDRSTWPATVVGTAPDKDLAVLKIEAPKKLLKALAVGQSDDLLVGQSVYAIGNPFGLDQTLTTGIISALDREIQSVSGLPIKGAIQTDAAINPGNSGGPLLDSSGRLIGVNTAIYSPSGAYAGIGFSIPVDVVKWVVPDLLKYGKLQRPVLGITPANNQFMSRIGVEGILVINTTKGGPAEQAGIQPTLRNQRGEIILGDIIKAINNEKVETNNDLLLTLEKYKAGQEVTVTLLRDAKEITIPVTLGATE